MNAVLSLAAGEQFQRYDAIRRRNAEQAYDRNAQYNGVNQKTLEKLEALLLGTLEEVEDIQPKTPSEKLGAGQMKQIALPLGKTLEESIDIWREVRKEALSEVEPLPIDFQLAAKASAEIISAEMKIALHNRAKSIREEKYAFALHETKQQASMSLPFESAVMERKLKTALSAYAIQSEMLDKNYEIEWPTIYQIA